VSDDQNPWPGWANLNAVRVAGFAHWLWQQMANTHFAEID